MYLSRLEILGFKSFAQRVGLAFDSGISSIVGPNGCGKTNIVDAIRWVLGEQRSSALRSERMEDVIFNGTKARKPLGMAEVSLVIENTKGILPSDYTQVTITRRVYRSGESEYLLNRIPCRLKDILDLFMDTGMGADAYSVIELKMIETILSDKTDERRHLFEEAAGVTKYKHRRRAAYRKLDAVRADLVRVNDIVAEVQKAVNALERQARKAEQFHEVKARLRAMEIDLMERELAQYHLRGEPLKSKLLEMRQEKAANASTLVNEETSLDQLRDRGMAAEQALSEWQRMVGAQREKIHRVEEQTLVAHERTRALNENVLRLEQDIARLEGDRVVLHELRADLLARIDELQNEEVRHRAALDERKGELGATTAQLDARRGELQQLNDGLITIVHEIADLQTELDRQTARMDNLAGRIERAEEEIAGYEQDSVRLDRSIEELSEQDRSLRRSNATAELRLYDAEAQRADLLARAEQQRGRELELRGDIERRRARGTSSVRSCRPGKASPTGRAIWPAPTDGATGRPAPSPMRWTPTSATASRSKPRSGSSVVACSWNAARRPTGASRCSARTTAAKPRSSASTACRSSGRQALPPAFPASSGGPRTWPAMRGALPPCSGSCSTA
jgi:chromosome segregation protein